jgi:hypothetical protein
MEERSVREATYHVGSGAMRAAARVVRIDVHCTSEREREETGERPYVGQEGPSKRNNEPL